MLTRHIRALLLRIFNEDTPLLNTFYPESMHGKKMSNGSTNKPNGEVSENCEEVADTSNNVQNGTINYEAVADGPPN